MLPQSGYERTVPFHATVGLICILFVPEFSLYYADHGQIEAGASLDLQK